MSPAASLPHPGLRSSCDPRPNLELVFTHGLGQDEALDRFVGGLTDMSGPCADTLEEVRAAPEGVDLVLHPAALPVEIRSLPGMLRASAFTLSLGPGYHAHVADALVAAAEQAGLRAAHDVIDAYLASGDLATRTIDMHIVKLREKLNDQAERPQILVTVRGKGYMLAAGESA